MVGTSDHTEDSRWAWTNDSFQAAPSGSTAANPVRNIAGYRMTRLQLTQRCHSVRFGTPATFLRNPTRHTFTAKNTAADSPT